jgi:predicted Ser/Thr protein kinase
METFGRYQVHETLGQGGMGVVYRAFDTVLERTVALKLLLSTEELDPELRARLFREARAAGNLKHRHIVTIYDLGEYDGRPYLAMEYLDGEDLQRRLKRPDKMSLARKLDLAIQICDGLAHAHAHGVVHRDIKPANIFIGEAGDAKLLDFGLARLMTSQLTRSNMLMGTLNYMAPEQVRGERADHRSDIFSTGVVLYELFGGKRAFEGDSVASTLYKILQEVPEPLSKLDAALPHELASIVDRTLAKLPDERYPSMESLRQDLERYREQYRLVGPATAMPPKMAAPDRAVPVRAVDAESRDANSALRTSVPAQGPRRWRNVAIAAALVAIVAVPAAWLLTHRGSAPAARTAPAVSMPHVDDGTIAARLHEAQQALDAHQYAAAVSAADAVLLVAPQNADAQRIRTAAREQGVDEAIERASRRLASGDASAAVKAAGEALALAPDNADARRILGAASAPSREPKANAPRARVAQKDVRTPAESGAIVRPPRAAAAQRPDRESHPPVGAGSNPPSPSPSIVAAPPSIPASSGPPPAAPTPGPSRSNQIPLASAPAPPTAPAAPAVPSAEERIRDLLERYKRALEDKNLEALKQLWPSLGGNPETAIRQEFEHAARISVGIESPRISVSGPAAAQVSFIRNYSLVTVEGQRLQSTTRAVMSVHRNGSAWVIDGIRFSER